MRSCIVLLAADGLQNKQIAEKLRVALRMAALWCGTFSEAGRTWSSEMRPGLDAHHRSPAR
jgi:transposase